MRHSGSPKRYLCTSFQTALAPLTVPFFFISYPQSASLFSHAFVFYFPISFGFIVCIFKHWVPVVVMAKRQHKLLGILRVLSLMYYFHDYSPHGLHS